MEGFAYYAYGIMGVETNNKNDSIIDIHYGNNKCPLHIFKKDVPMFIKALISSEEISERGIERIVEGGKIEELNHILKGRAMILATDFRNYFEYCNQGQCLIKRIMGMKIDGKIGFASYFDYESLEPKYKDLYFSE